MKGQASRGTVCFEINRFYWTVIGARQVAHRVQYAFSIRRRLVAAAQVADAPHASIPASDSASGWRESQKFRLTALILSGENSSRWCDSLTDEVNEVRFGRTSR